MRLTLISLMSMLGVIAIAAPPHHGHGAAGTYQGTCYAQYAGTQAAPCAMTMYVDRRGNVTIPGNAGCISPTNFTGYLNGMYADLRAPGWNAQPQGQTLQLSFNPQGHTFFASGSGRGIKDGKWTYSCSFQRQGW